MGQGNGSIAYRLRTGNGAQYVLLLRLDLTPYDFIFLIFFFSMCGGASELDGTKNEEVFGEEIVVKDMHTRKALMNKLVSQQTNQLSFD